MYIHSYISKYKLFYENITYMYTDITILLIVPSLQGTAQSITVLEGQSFTFSCTPTPNDIMVNWTMNDHIIVSSEHIALSPEHLHHTITISDAVTGDSGEYFCFIEDLEFLSLFINKTITINVLQGNFTYVRMYICMYICTYVRTYSVCTFMCYATYVHIL